MRALSLLWTLSLCVGCGGGSSEASEPVEPVSVAGDEAQEVDPADQPGAGDAQPECEACVESTGGCVRPGPHPAGEGARPTQNIPCDPACCEGGQTYAGGLRAICGCPAEVDAARQPDWTPDQTASALGTCLTERGTNARVAALVESFADGDRVASLQAALDEAGISGCALSDVWSQ